MVYFFQPHRDIDFRVAYKLFIREFVAYEDKAVFNFIGDKIFAFSNKKPGM